MFRTHLLILILKLTNVLVDNCTNSSTCTIPFGTTNLVADNGDNEAQGTPAVVSPQDVEPQPVGHGMRTWLKDIIQQPKQFTDGTIRYDPSCRRAFIATTLSVSEPRNLIEAMNTEVWR